LSFSVTPPVSSSESVTASQQHTKSLCKLKNKQVAKMTRFLSLAFAALVLATIHAPVEVTAQECLALESCLAYAGYGKFVHCVI
jgi:hypothetical protein